MRIFLDLRGDLARRATAAQPGARGAVELPDGASVASLASLLGLAPARVVFVVNGAAARSGQPLRDGDRVQAFPAAAGG